VYEHVFDEPFIAEKVEFTVKIDNYDVAMAGRYELMVSDYYDKSIKWNVVTQDTSSAAYLRVNGYLKVKDTVPSWADNQKPYI